MEKLINFAVAVSVPIAAIVSYAKWHSIGWAILHGFCGWMYLFYYWWTNQGG